MRINVNNIPIIEFDSINVNFEVSVNDMLNLIPDKTPNSKSFIL